MFPTYTPSHKINCNRLNDIRSKKEKKKIQFQQLSLQPSPSRFQLPINSQTNKLLTLNFGKIEVVRCTEIELCELPMYRNETVIMYWP